MARPLNWMLSGSPAKKRTSRALREQLAVTTILAVVPFLGYGRQAYASCVFSAAPSTYTCSGTSAGENFTGPNSVDNANFVTAASPPFVVTDSGVAITGFGDMRFTDHNSSSITNLDGPGLRVESYGNYFGEDFAEGAVTIDTNATITGYNGDGINARNYGSGNISITADGRVSGYSSDIFIAADGIYAKNYGRDLTITTGAKSDIFGADNGIDARNLNNYEDAGSLVVTADGYVTGYNNDGIHALNRGLDLTITTGEQSVVRGGGNGIGAYNTGNGDLTIEANGWVAGYGEDADGIHAFNFSGAYYPPGSPYFIGANGKSLIITTGAKSTIIGAYIGIEAYNHGSGELNITAGGRVRGYDGAGIDARNIYGSVYDAETEESRALTITTGAKSDVYGRFNGIYAVNGDPQGLSPGGNGTFTITANGYVTGQLADGIHGFNGEDGQIMTITTGAGSTVTGYGDDGINAIQRGSGNLVIKVGGSVTGVGENTPVEDPGSFGIEAYQSTSNKIDDITQITVESGGLVQGETGGIYVRTWNHNITITNDGMIRNLSGESSDLAIRTFSEDSGYTHVVNDGNLIGTVEFQAFDGQDTLDNGGFWNMAGGDSNFGESSEDAINNTGVLVAADDSSSPETTRIYGLEYFNNNGGLISLLDGAPGDVLELYGSYGPTNYDGDNGHLAVDAVLGPGSGNPAGDHLSDQFIIHGGSDGTTIVHVNVVAANGANIEGIPVVLVDNYTSDQDFKLDGPLSGGFFTWDMRLNPDNKWWELFTVTGNGSDEPVLGAGAFEFPAGFAATQDIWLQTIGTALHRQADLRSLLQGLSVTPVADYSEPVAPTPIGGAGAIMAPGFWFQGFGAYVERDDEQNGYDLAQKQTTYGGMAGFDFGTKEAFANAWLFGVFGGYIGSDLKFTATDTRWNFEGPTAGAYVTYLDHAFYADATVKADFLNIKINPDELASEADDSHTNAVNVGGLFDTGYRVGHSAFVEPQASLAVVHTEVDDVNMYGGTVKFDDDTSVRGRLGLRLGVEHTHTDSTVYLADVTGSVWENFTGGDSDVTVADTGLPDFGVSDNQESTYGDVSLGLSAANPDGWSTFVRGNYVFADDYEAWTGNAGARFVW